MRVRVKICGVKTPADGVLAAEAGADAVGLNFHPPSPRAVDSQRAAEIAAALPPFCATVAVFVDPPAHLVETVLKDVKPHALQFHGDEPPAFCRQFGHPYIKAAGIRAGFDFAAFAERYADAKALLLDTFDAEQKGGSGRSFDWSLWPRTERPLILAGGINPDNVRCAIAATRPFAVDVASGVEGPIKGRKDAQRIKSFFAAVASA